MSDFMIDFNEWDKNGNVFTYPSVPDKCNWYDFGLVPKNDFSADLFEWYGFTFDVDISGTRNIEIRVGLLDFGEINSEEIIDYFVWNAVVCGNGTIRVVAPLNQFSVLSQMPGKWRFLRSVEFNCEVKNLKAVKSASVYAHAPVMSKAAEADEVINYKLSLINTRSTSQAVALRFEHTGYEILEPQLSENDFVLLPYEEKEIELNVKMSDKIVSGGFEKHILNVIPNGDGTASQKLEFYSVRKLPHPFIVNNESGWQDVIKKIDNYEWAAKLADKYIENAMLWEVPEIGYDNNGMFVTKNSDKCYNSSVAWKLTGNKAFAEKSAEFLRRVSDPKKGYITRMKACNQQLVHEGEFFKYCSMSYDLICDLGVLSEEDDKNIKDTFRAFVDFLDWQLTDGGISNWSLAELAGAMYCAMNLQDREKIERFVYGVGGVLDHLRAGVLSDGWWCECTIGYNQMAAGLFSEYTVALRPWGINLASLWVPASYSNKVHFRNQHADGLSWDIYGENTRNYRCIEDLWDSLVAMANYRSIVQGVNDSAEEAFEGASPASFDSRYDIAYAIYRKPEYAAIIKNGGENILRDLFHGVAELPDVTNDACHKSYYFNNGGIALLRTNTEGRKDEEQFEISLKYGSHGGAHGHYDRCSLNAVSRFGKALFNPENIWYSYGTFMYKFFVQNSITHNMVTVDLKLQDPQESRQLLFHSGKLFQASEIINTSRWSNPPYGGWRVFSGEEFEDRIWIEGRYLPIPKNHPPYTKRTDFTEPVTQRRMAILTDDYVLCFDRIESENEHNFDCIYHLAGLQNINNNTLEHIEHTEQLTTDPLSSAQFITDVDRYEESGITKLSFKYNYDERVSGKAPWMQTPFRSGHNICGVLNTDLYYINNEKRDLYVGCDPEYYPVSKRLFYKVAADGETVADGKFGAWILGRDHIDVDIKGKKELKLYVRTEDGKIDHNNVKETIKTIFWGDPYFVTADGKKQYLADTSYTSENTDNGRGIGVDYAGGKVKIQTKEFTKAVPADVIDKSKEGIITIDVSGINAVRFVSDIGGDYPVGDESERRRFISERKYGKTAEFISILEPYTDKKMIKSVKADDGITVELNDGRTQKIYINNDDVLVEEYRDGVIIRKEMAKGKE